jgi:hypothetical protein
MSPLAIGEKVYLSSIVTITVFAKEYVNFVSADFPLKAIYKVTSPAA